MQKSKWEGQIDKDIFRTFTEESIFNKNPRNYDILKKVLLAYSNYDKQVGYAQGFIYTLLTHYLGMNFIAGAVILYLIN